MRKAIVMGLLMIGTRGWTTNGYIQSTSCNGNAGSVACAFTLSITAGNTIIVGCLGGTSSALPTDNHSQVYTAVGTKISPVSRDMNVFYFLNAAGGATTVTCTNSSSNGIQAAVSEYGSTVTAGGFDVTSSSVPVVTTLVTATSGNATTSTSNELMFEFCNLASAASASNGTLRENFANNFFQATQDTIVASPSSYASTITQSAGTFGCIEAAFKVSGGSTPVGNCVSPFCGVLGQ